MISDAQRSPELEEQLAPILEGRAVYAFQSVGSTMEVAHELAAEGAPEGTLVFASRQEQGRLVVRLDSGVQRNFEMGEVTLLR